MKTDGAASAQTWLPLYMPVPVDIRRSVSPRSLLLHTESPLVATYRCDISHSLLQRSAAHPAEYTKSLCQTEHSQRQHVTSTHLNADGAHRLRCATTTISKRYPKARSPVRQRNTEGRLKTRALCRPSQCRRFRT